MTEPATPTAYPPLHHIVRDLRVVIDRSQGDWAIRLPIVPAIFDAADRPRVGVAAVIADMIAGQTVIREVAPNWIATSNLALQVGELPSEGTLVGHPKVLRKGATTIVITASGSPLAHASSSGAHVLLAADHPEDYDRYSPMVSRLLHLTIIDILTTGVALRLGAELRPMLAEIKRNLRAKRYAKAD